MKYYSRKGNKMKKYKINYGYGVAYLYTPYKDYEDRFYTLANTCFGIRKCIIHCDLISVEDVYCNDFERLEFGGDVYVWREDGARKMLFPYKQKEWDTFCCDECKYHKEVNE